MSIAKINTVQKSQKDQGKCGKCGTLLPKGTAYRWFKVGFRSRSKNVRCMATACTPRPSERESSSKSAPMASMEEFEVGGPYTTQEDLETAWMGVQVAFRDYADECEAALEGWPNGNADLEERRDGAEAASDEVECWEPDEYSGPVDDEGEPLSPEDLRDHLQNQYDEALEIMGSAEGNWA